MTNFAAGMLYGVLITGSIAVAVVAGANLMNRAVNRRFEHALDDVLGLCVERQAPGSNLGMVDAQEIWPSEVIALVDKALNGARS